MLTNEQRNTISWYLGNDDRPLRTGRYDLADRGHAYLANGGDMMSPVGRVIAALVTNNRSMKVADLHTETELSTDTLNRLLPRMVIAKYVLEV